MPVVEIRTPMPLVEQSKLSDNVFSIISSTKMALERSKIYSKDEIAKIIEEMTISDYDNAVKTMLDYCIIDS